MRSRRREERSRRRRGGGRGGTEEEEQSRKRRIFAGKFKSYGVLCSLDLCLCLTSSECLFNLCVNAKHLNLNKDLVSTLCLQANLNQQNLETKRRRNPVKSSTRSLDLRSPNCSTGPCGCRILFQPPQHTVDSDQLMK